jgi:hypothetical protein
MNETRVPITLRKGIGIEVSEIDVLVLSLNTITERYASKQEVIDRQASLIREQETEIKKLKKNIKELESRQEKRKREQSYECRYCQKAFVQTTDDPPMYCDVCSVCNTCESVGCALCSTVGCTCKKCLNPRPLLI